MARVFVSGGAGFIGSHICERLLGLGHEVVCYDNLVTGFRENIQHLIGIEGFFFVESDIRDIGDLRKALSKCSHVCHQAALGSVPRSVEDPLRTNDMNLVGSLNLLNEAHRLNIKRFVFASSSSVYGDNLDMPKVEQKTGEVLSPYAVTKSAFEDYARVFYHINEIETIGLRYFNVYGPRQSPEGSYAAVIPIFMSYLKKSEQPTIFGDGEQTRDFTYVSNAVDANVLALFGEVPDAFGRSFNVACGKTLTINKIFTVIRESINERIGEDSPIEAIHGPPRSGDIKDSLADLSEAKRCLGYTPKVFFSEGIAETVDWFFKTNG